MKGRGTLPDLVVEGPHETQPSFHDDWTLVEGSRSDPEKWELELRLRDARNRMIREHLSAGRTVFYKSSGNSMWPLVQANDACLFHPIQAVTAEQGVHSIEKAASEIHVGDVVFCQVQISQQYYAHIVLEKYYDRLARQTTYVIGNIKYHKNGWCWREHIFGILVDVSVWYNGEYWSRPLPRLNFQEVAALMQNKRGGSDRADHICQPAAWQA